MSSNQPSRSSSNQRRLNRYRDRSWRPDRPDGIVDDFAVMPRVPEALFDPHREYAFGAPLDEWADTARRATTGELNRPLNSSRPQCPQNGYDGAKIGMIRCKYCKSWCSPQALIDEKCTACREPQELEDENDDQKDK